MHILLQCTFHKKINKFGYRNISLESWKYVQPVQALSIHILYLGNSSCTDEYEGVPFTGIALRTKC